MREDNTGKPTGRDPGELDRNAFNIAFGELGLCWHWDEETYAELQRIAAEGDRLLAYLRTQHEYLLKAYDANFLVDAIRATKMRCYDDLIRSHGDH